MNKARVHLMVCAGTGCVSNRSGDVRAALVDAIGECGLEGEVQVVSTGCNGFCAQGPIVVFYPDGIFYCRVGAGDVPEIVEEHLLKGRPVQRLMFTPPKEEKAVPKISEIGFFKHQRLIALRNRGLIDPENIDEYIGRDGYAALARALKDLKPSDVIEEAKRSGLRGRGGGGFPTGLKWEFARKAGGTEKFIVCNADEGDPGAFMDRSIIEADPHSIIEGMAIGAFAIGASHGFIYVRAEYPLALHRLKIAIAQAKEYGLLGRGVLGTDFDFNLHITRGAGAFVCGEETSLMASVMGLTGEPRQRPPFPAESGLWGEPTNINNVETWANIPPILLNGADWFASIGTEKSKGTKVFSLVGKVENTGLVEVPMGIPLRDIIFEIGGGIPDGHSFKAVQTGGPSGGCIPESLLDLEVDFDELQKVGSIMGSGGMIVMDDTTCMVDLARYFLDFLKDESCGKCTPCREGIARMLEILTGICEGRGREGDIELLQDLGAVVRDFSLCGLGQTAANPVLSTIRYFRHEYDAHIREKYCPAQACKRITPAPCQHACPIGQDVPSYVALVAQEKFDEAYDLIRMDNPIPATLGRVCVHHCEDACKRGEIDKPIRICALKRFASDESVARLKRLAFQARRPGGKRVAVVGAGPAGLACANDLALKGYRPTIFEAHPVPGGMLHLGIPAYRLPRDILLAEVKAIQGLGVKLELNSPVTSIQALKDQGFEAVFLGVGAHKGLKLNVPGENDFEGFLDCTTFLREVNLGQRKEAPGDKLIVIGGGNASMDAVRSSIRLGAKEVNIVYRRTEAEMPANPAEIRAAKEEGIRFHFLASPVRIQGESGKVTGMTCIRNELGEPDSTGRRRPVPVDGSEFTIEADCIIPAISQEPDLDFLGENASGFHTTRWNTFEVHPETLHTNVEGVFAGGDCVSGPSTVVEAVAAGQRAAVSIDCYLRNEEVYQGYKRPRPRRVVERVELTQEDESQQRAEMPERDPAERKTDFKEVELGLEEQAACNEARRCLRCDVAG